MCKQYWLVTCIIFYCTFCLYTTSSKKKKCIPSLEGICKYIWLFLFNKITLLSEPLCFVSRKENKLHVIFFTMLQSYWLCTLTSHLTLHFYQNTLLIEKRQVFDNFYISQIKMGPFFFLFSHVQNQILIHFQGKTGILINNEGQPSLFHFLQSNLKFFLHNKSRISEKFM